MGTVFLGQSKCPICNDIIDDSRPYVVTPPLTSNIEDPLFNLCDCAIHTRCLDKYQYKADLLYHIDQYMLMISRARSLKVDNPGAMIPTPKSIVPLGMLTSVPKFDMYSYNYLVIDAGQLENWDMRENFLRVARQFLRDGLWQNFGDRNNLEWLINKLS